MRGGNLRRQATLAPTWVSVLVLVGGCPSRMEMAPLLDIGAETGLAVTHDNGMTGERYFSEIVGPGAALFDYDLDGDLDLYLVQGGSLAPAELPQNRPGDTLLRNDTTASGRLRWTDVTAASGVEAKFYGMGVAVGDVDGDGFPDLYVTNLGPNQLWLNRGDGTFVDATSRSLADPRWSTSTTFLDYDLDGDLDLFATNYVEYRIAQHRPCLNAAGAVEYCGPAGFAPETDRLWRNNGDGTYEDVSGPAGLIDHPGSGLGVVSADFDGDGWPDIYVANDLMPNHLWLNQGDGSFVEDALLAGCAVNENGAPEASMGLAIADFDRDGDEDLFMTHLDTETNTAFASDGRGLFTDASNEWGLAVPSLGLTGFGTAAIDFDNDGWLDLIAANGAVKTILEQRVGGNPLPLREPNLLLRNIEGRFDDVTYTVPALRVPGIGRGLAIGDIDNDGDDDVVIANNNAPAQLLRNEVGQSAPWIGLRLVGARGLGARVRWHQRRPAIRELLKVSRTGQSYCSASDPRVRIGGPPAEGGIEVEPLGGRRWRLEEPPGDHYLSYPLPTRPAA